MKREMLHLVSFHADQVSLFPSLLSLKISLGDARSYFLSTASNHLGVIYALPSPSPSALSGNRGSEEALLPLNWQEMQCPRTGVIEKRKVAKPE